ncbi:MAG: hypothetical protein DIU69_07415, partial [Bacillota bacterium]
MKRRVVAVTACPTGIAHTYMAAEALEKAAREKGIEIRVETRGSVGVENALTQADIEAADAVIIAADAKVDTARFAGKPLVEASVGEAIRDAAKLLDRALAAAAARTAEEPGPTTATAARGATTRRGGTPGGVGEERGEGGAAGPGPLKKSQTHR